MGVLLAGSGCKKSETPAPQKVGKTVRQDHAGHAGQAGREATPIKVGAIFAVTGGAANLGGPEAKTAEMFVENLNKAGGINGRKIQLIVKDSAQHAGQGHLAGQAAHR